MAKDSTAAVLARIEQKLDSHMGAFEEHREAFAKHIEDDRKAYGAIIDLKVAQANQRGFLTALGLAASGLGAALGWLVERTLGHH